VESSSSVVAPRRAGFAGRKSDENGESSVRKWRSATRPLLATTWSSTMRCWPQWMTIPTPTRRPPPTRAEGDRALRQEAKQLAADPADRAETAALRSLLGEPWPDLAP
jgi:hypothetical protein